MESGFFFTLFVLFSVVPLNQGDVNLTESANRTEIIVQCLGLNCSSNGTNYEEVGTLSPPTTIGPPTLPCPDGYRLMRSNGKWIHACQPMSCSGPPSKATRICQRITPDLIMCPKVYLEEHQYRLDDEGNLDDLLQNYTWFLGDYVIEEPRAIVCDMEWNETLPNPPNWAELPKGCMPIPIENGGYRRTAHGIYVNALGHEVRLFTEELNAFTGELRVTYSCPELDLSFFDNDCAQLGTMPGDELEVLPNWDIKDHKNVLLMAVYHRGEYIMAEDRSFVVICIDAGEILSVEATYAFGAISIVSAFCLLLALLAHLFFPTLNYHAKALLCFAFSLFIMYIAMAVRSFCGNFESPVANLTLFSVQYIFSLASFFWLSILAFDLWRVFANLRGTLTPGNTTGKKRVFFAKCVYAWGIPTLLCITIISLTFSPNIQKSLRLDLQLESVNWFIDPTTMLIVFYTPISIILIENVIFFILTIINLRKASSGTDILNKKMNRKLFRVYMKLFLVMGLCWFAEVISNCAIGRTEEEVWYVTDIINCLQGVFIFLIYVCKKKTILIIKNKMGQISNSQINSSTSSTQDRDRKISAISMEAMQKRAAMKTSSTNSRRDL